MSKSREDFYRRMRELRDYGNSSVSNNKETTLGTLMEDVVRSNDGTAYGIVKENHRYIIKKSTVQDKNNLDESDFVYINGVQNKYDYNYNTLAEAEKQRNLMINSLNEAYDLGGIYSTQKKIETPKLEIEENVNSFLSNVIKSGKQKLKENHEIKFKTTLKENKEEVTKKSSGLMPENALNAVQKALGKINEEDLVTADSEITDGDKVANKSGKESPQAPINDSNAKSEADKATATGTADFNKKENPSDSLAVNQQDGNLSEGEDLSTADSEINANESPANHVNATKESAQAPINDTNAKSEADKATASGSASQAISNNVEESPESDPFDDKENAGDEKSDIVSESAKVDGKKSDPFDEKATDGSGDEVTADSDHTDGDRVDNETKSEATEAPYGAEKQPEKGHKEEKGKKLEPKAKKDGIWEGEEDKEGEIEININEIMEGIDDMVSDLEDKTEEEKEEKPAPEAPVDEPAPDMGGEEMPDMGGEEMSSDEPEMGDGGDAGETPADMVSDIESDIEDDLGMPDVEDVAGDADMGGEEGEENDDIKELEKYVGKINQIVTNPDVDLTNDKAKELVNSILGSFKDDIGALEAEDKKEMADKIVRAEAGAEAGGDEPAPDMGDDDIPEDPEAGAEDVMGGLDAEMEDAEKEVTGEGACNECGSFQQYAESRGYSDFNECSESEMANIVSGYLSNKEGEQLSEEECETLAPYLNDTVKGELEEYGHVTYVEELQPFTSKLNETDFFDYHGTQVNEEDYDDDEIELEAGIPDDDMSTATNTSYDDEENPSYGDDFVGSDLPSSQGDLSPDAKSALKSMSSSNFDMDEPIHPDPDEFDPELEPAGEMPDEIKAMGLQEDGEEEIEDDEVPVELETGGVGFAAPETMGAGMPKPSSAAIKSVEVDANAGTVSVNMGEGEKRLRKYIREHLEVLAGKRKPSLNESKKSDKLKKLDKLIESQFKLAEGEVKKKIKSLTEGDRRQPVTDEILNNLQIINRYPELKEFINHNKTYRYDDDVWYSLIVTFDIPKTSELVNEFERIEREFTDSWDGGVGQRYSKSSIHTQDMGDFYRLSFNVDGGWDV